jgi:glycosyltransferase involved in cell wall biosynthesis
MEEVWLSVIVPSHNGSVGFTTALQSIADQKERGIEVIVIDSSTENTSLAIAESFSTQSCNSRSSAT